MRSDPATSASHGCLGSLFEHARERALVALTEADGRPADAVAWLSAHIAAAEHAVYPALLRDPATTRLRRDAHHLLLSVRELEHACAGGPLPAGATLARVREHVVDTLAAFAVSEQEAVARLVDDLDDVACARLAERYEAALLIAPTRPHPHGAHRGVFERVTFTFDRMRDRALDLMDARHTPLPRRAPRPPRRLGRWGRYALGAVEDVEPKA